MLLLWATALAGRLEFQESKVEHNVTLSGGHSGVTASGTAGYSGMFATGKNHRFRMGPGFRFLGFFADSADFSRTGFANNLGLGHNRTLPLEVEMISVNLGLYLQFQFSNRFEMGFNTDITGLTFTTGSLLTTPGDNGASLAELWFGVHALPNSITVYAAPSVHTLGESPFSRVELGGRVGLNFVL